MYARSGRRVALALIAILSVVPVSFVHLIAHAAPAITADEVLAYTNVARFYEGVPFLAHDPLLSRVALTKMQDLFAREYFAHDAPTGEDVSDLADQVGYAYIAVGENLALGDFENSREVVEAWMESPGHRKNLLSSTYSEIGVAAGRGMYDGRKTWIVVQSFGLPRSSCSEIDDDLLRTIEGEREVLALLERVVEMRRAQLENVRTGTRTYRERVTSYNKAADLFNARMQAHRAHIERYNTEVETFNACILERTAGA